SVTTLTVNMGGDNGTLAVASLPDFTKTLTINGQAGIDNVVFQGVDSLTALSINVAGAVTDSSGNVSVTNNASFTAGSVVLGENGETVNFGTLTLTVTGNVAISEASAMDLAGASSANTLSLTATGNITLGSGSSLTATTSADFHSPLVIGGALSFTSATVTSGNVTLSSGSLQAPNAT